MSDGWSSTNVTGACPVLTWHRACYAAPGCEPLQANMGFQCIAGIVASHGWQGAARALGGTARENAVTAQCPESLTMRHVSKMYA
jgi:hypothetical protein